MYSLLEFEQQREVDQVFDYCEAKGLCLGRDLLAELCMEHGAENMLYEAEAVAPLMSNPIFWALIGLDMEEAA